MDKLHSSSLFHSGINRIVMRGAVCWLNLGLVHISRTLVLLLFKHTYSFCSTIAFSVNKPAQEAVLFLLFHKSLIVPCLSIWLSGPNTLTLRQLSVKFQLTCHLIMSMFLLFLKVRLQIFQIREFLLKCGGMHITDVFREIFPESFHISDNLRQTSDE